jgi:hypothetical protein
MLNNWLDRVRIVQAALAHHHGKGLLRSSVGGSWGNSLYEEEAQTIDVEEVSLMTLEEILGNERPQIIKCNAEGGEYELVSQLCKVDVRPLLLIIMVHTEFGNMEKLVSEMIGIGYRAVRTGTEKRPAFHFWRDDLPLAAEETEALKAEG